MIQIFGINKMPLVKSQDDIGEQLVRAVRDQSMQILDHDIIVVAQKIVSKAEGRVVDLQTVTPSTLANTIAESSEKDPKHVEVILRESANIIRMRGAHIIVETRHGFVCANAGVDRSNAGNGDLAVLLPIDPDRAAQKLRKRIRELAGVDVGVIISDTFGRAWRNGQVNVAIGIDGLTPIIDYRGSRDLFGNQLKVTQIAIADELASAAELVMRKSDGVPVAIIRGIAYAKGSGSVQQLIRPKEEDLFR
ncbi:MAG: coenzyme F420-0:L-glutamate ligase [Candidatus Bathyarchaeia archaeon]